MSSKLARSAHPWKADRDATLCARCQKGFTFFRRRHHCRQCGNIFCNGCSRHRCVVPQVHGKKLQRVCEPCFDAPKVAAEERKEEQAVVDAVVEEAVAIATMPAVEEAVVGEAAIIQENAATPAGEASQPSAESSNTTSEEQPVNPESAPAAESTPTVVAEEDVASAVAIEAAAAEEVQPAQPDAQPTPVEETKPVAETQPEPSESVSAPTAEPVPAEAAVEATVAVALAVADVTEAQPADAAEDTSNVQPGTPPPEVEEVAAAAAEDHQDSHETEVSEPTTAPKSTLPEAENSETDAQADVPETYPLTYKTIQAEPSEPTEGKSTRKATLTDDSASSRNFVETRRNTQKTRAPSERKCVVPEVVPEVAEEVLEQQRLLEARQERERSVAAGCWMMKWSTSTGRGFMQRRSGAQGEEFRKRYICIREGILYFGESENSLDKQIPLKTIKTETTATPFAAAARTMIDAKCPNNLAAYGLRLETTGAKEYRFAFYTQLSRDAFVAYLQDVIQ